MGDKRDGILITGGTGFLGRAIAKTLLADERSQGRVCIYSRNEHAQARMFAELGEHPRLRMWIGDVRDRDRLCWAMQSVERVIHAAALKRIEVGHYNPGEMVKTNIGGSVNVVESAIAAGVHRAVLVSTDKAYQPVSAYGVSKAMAEAIFMAANNTVGRRGPRFGVCRYGNVAGSTGSVIPVWRERMAQGLPIQVTDPECTRFWMTDAEAVELVLTTLAGREELRIPTIPAFDIGTLARAMGAQKIEITGLNRWEKKHESLTDTQSSDRAPRMTIEHLQAALENV